MKVNGFEAGTIVGAVNVTVANSDDAGEDAFSSTNTGTGGTIAYTTTDAYIGSWCAQFTQATAGNQPVMVQLNEGAGATSFAIRTYIYLTGYPSALSSFIQMRSTTDVNLFSANLSTTGQIRQQNAAAVDYGTTTGTLNLNQWYRVEMFGSGLNGSSGNVTTAFYDGHASSPVDSVNSTTVSTGALCDRVRFGRMSTNTLATWKMDSLGINMGSATPFGPAVVSSTVISYGYDVVIGG